MHNLTEYLRHVKDKRRTWKQKYNTIRNEMQWQGMEKCLIEHTQPTDTEVNDRKKFMRLFQCS